MIQRTNNATFYWAVIMTILSLGYFAGLTSALSGYMEGKDIATGGWLYSAAVLTYVTYFFFWWLFPIIAVICWVSWVARLRGEQKVTTISSQNGSERAVPSAANPHGVGPGKVIFFLLAAVAIFINSLIIAASDDTTGFSGGLLMILSLPIQVLTALLGAFQLQASRSQGKVRRYIGVVLLIVLMTLAIGVWLQP